MDDNDLIRYIGGETVNTDFHDGQLRPVVGTHNYQVFRANRTARSMPTIWGGRTIMLRCWPIGTGNFIWSI